MGCSASAAGTPDGRSKILRELVASYLKERRQAVVDSQYAAGYGGEAKANDDLAGWNEEGEWPATDRR